MSLYHLIEMYLYHLLISNTEHQANSIMSFLNSYKTEIWKFIFSTSCTRQIQFLFMTRFTFYDIIKDSRFHTNHLLTNTESLDIERYKYYDYHSKCHTHVF